MLFNELIKQCRNCKSFDIELIINLGNQPPSNSFLDPKKDLSNEHKYPLQLVFCTDCYLVQLNYSVNPSEMYSDYVYLSSSSRVLREHLDTLAKHLIDYVKPKSEDLVIDIGCNDGALLDGYKGFGLKRLGIEPSSVAEIARSKGLNVQKSFFNKETANIVARKYGRAKIITGTNVFAHVSDQDEFLEGIEILLKDDGVFVIEVPHVLDMLKNILFDTIYHEHIFYFSILSLKNLLERRNFRIFNIEKLNFGPSGPPIRVYVCKTNSNHKNNKSVQDLIDLENESRLFELKPYLVFKDKIWRLKNDLLEMLHKIKKSNGKIIGYGAPAKGNTILNTFGIGNQFLDAILENNELKTGLVSPGTHVPIELERDFDSSGYKYALLLSWNLLEFFLKKSPYIKAGGKFILPLPKPIILPN